MRISRLLQTGLALLVLSHLRPAWAEDTDVAASLSPDAAAAASLSLHPAVLAATHELRSAKGLRQQSAVFLNNPQLSGQISSDGQRASASAMQPVSVSGEGWHTRRVASHSVDAATARLHRAELIAAADARRAYAKAVVAIGAVRVARQGVELAQRLSDAVALQLDAGGASLLDLRLAQLSHTTAVAALLSANEAQSDALGELSSRVGLPVTAPQIDLTALSVQQALEPRPSDAAAPPRSDVVAAQADVAAAMAQRRAQGAAAVPVVGLGAFISVEDGERFIGPQLSIGLPLFDRNQQQRGAASADVDTTRATAHALSARAHSDRQTATARLGDARTYSATLVDDPLQTALDALHSIEIGYLEGEIDLATTLLLQREVLQGEHAAYAVLGSTYTALIDQQLATEDPALLGGAR